MRFMIEGGTAGDMRVEFIAYCERVAHNHTVAAGIAPSAEKRAADLAKAEAMRDAALF